MLLNITHDTCYDYQPAVDLAQHVAYLRPMDTVLQTVLAHDFSVTPEPSHSHIALDVFGNTRQFFALQAPHAQLRVLARSQVRTGAPCEGESQIAWEAVRERFQYRAGSAYDSAAEFVFASSHAPRNPVFAEFARSCFAPGRPMLLGARALMQRIHDELQYESFSTQVNTPAIQALAQRKGVCQDFAHIMIACLRTLGLSARYVSGYLLTEPAPGQPRLVGADASHAWVSVYLPDLPDGAGTTRWWDFDPTNARDGLGTPGEDYVTLAVGRDFADVSPIRGVIRGGAHHTLTVGVTVEPSDPLG